MVEETPGRRAFGPVWHNEPGGTAPAAVVFIGDTRIVLSPDFAFAAQVLGGTPEGQFVLFQLVSVKTPDGKEMTTTLPLDNPQWQKLAAWLAENALPGDFQRSLVYSLVTHVNEHPDMQFVMIGGSQLAKAGKGICVLLGDKGVVTKSCDAQALNVEPNRSVSFEVPGY